MYMAQLSVAPLRREANGLWPFEIDRGHPHVIYSRADPTHVQTLHHSVFVPLFSRVKVKLDGGLPRKKALDG